jgi:sec-independent protein translocase protein TatB
MLPGLGPVHLLMVLVVALLVLGPTKLPEMARHVGSAMQTYRDIRDRIRLDLDPRTHLNTVVETVLEGPPDEMDGREETGVESEPPVATHVGGTDLP